MRCGHPTWHLNCCAKSPPLNSFQTFLVMDSFSVGRPQELRYLQLGSAALSDVWLLISPACVLLIIPSGTITGQGTPCCFGDVLVFSVREGMNRLRLLPDIL